MESSYLQLWDHEKFFIVDSSDQPSNTKGKRSYWDWIESWWITLNRNLWLALLVVTSIAFGDNIQLIRIKRILILIKLSENHPTSLWTRKLRGIWKNRDYLWSDENTCLGPAAHQLKRWRMNWRLERNYKLIFISVGMAYKLWRVGVRISAAQFGPARNWKNETKSIYF